MSEQSIFTAEEYSKNFKKNKKGKKEEALQIQVCDYIRNTYPDVIFMCDLASGLKLPVWIGLKHSKMRSSRGLPDLFIAKALVKYTGKMNMMGDEETCGQYNGLFIEIKKDGTRLKNGQIPKSDHHDEQATILVRLNQLGYKAVFGCGFEECKKIIDDYLK